MELGVLDPMLANCSRPLPGIISAASYLSFIKVQSVKGQGLCALPPPRC